MDHRFERARARIEERVDRGEPLRDVLACTRSSTLVAALAAAGACNPVLANVIATELLNRLNRAPFLGAAAVSTSTLLVTFIFEWAYTGTPFLVEEASARAYAVTAFLAIVSALSLCTWAMWRGRFPRARAWLLRAHKREY